MISVYKVIRNRVCHPTFYQTSVNLSTASADTVWWQVYKNANAYIHDLIHRHIRYSVNDYVNRHLGLK